MTSLTKGANAPLNELRLTFTMDLPEPADLAVVLQDGAATARGSQNFLFAGGPTGQGVTVKSDAGGRGGQVDLDLSEFPDGIEVARLVATLVSDNSTFGQLEHARAILTSATGIPQVEFVVQGLGSETTLVMLELYRRQGAWKVRAVGQGYADGLTALLTDHGIDAATTEIHASHLPAITTVEEPPPRADPPTAPALTRPFASVLWKRVESPKQSEHAVRPVAWPTRGTEFTVCESVRNTVPDSDDLPAGTDKFMVTEQWSHALRPFRGAGFESTWRDDSDGRLDPTWVTLRSALVDEATGRVVACGHLTHENWNLSPAYDLGAITGSNGMSWPGQGHADGLFYPTESLYIGSTRTGVLVPVDSRSNLSAVDLDAASGAIAVLESLGTVGCLSMYDGELGTRRRLTLLDKISGNERLRFSLDGQWLLVPRYDGSYLCEVATGRMLRLPLTNCCWWPLADSTLLEIAHVDGKCIPRLFNLELNEYVGSFPAVVLDHPMLPDLPYTWNPAVSPDGAEVLVLTPTGVSVAHRNEHAVGNHLARFTLADGRGQLAYPALLDTQHPWERDVSEARWVGTYPRRPVSLHPDLQLQLESPALEHESLEPGRYASEAEQVLVKTLNLAIAHTQRGEDLAYLMPEVVMSLVTLHDEPARWAAQREWLVGLVETTSQMITNGELVGRDAAAWGSFRSAMQGIESGRPTAVSPIDAAWSSHLPSSPGAQSPSSAATSATPPVPYPSATAEQRQMMESIMSNVVGKRDGGSFEPKQIAAISSLCERLVAENPDLTTFVDDLRRVAQAEVVARPQDPAWRALVSFL